MQPFVFLTSPHRVGDYVDHRPNGDVRTFQYSYRGFEGETYADPNPLSGHEWVGEWKHTGWPDEYGFVFADGPNEKVVLCASKLAIDRMHWVMFGPDHIVEAARPPPWKTREKRFNLLHRFWDLMDQVQERGETIDTKSVARELERQCQEARRRRYSNLHPDRALSIGYDACDQLDRLSLDERRAIIQGMVDAAYCAPEHYHDVVPSRGGYVGTAVLKRHPWGILRKNPGRRGKRWAVVNRWLRARRGQA